MSFTIKTALNHLGYGVDIENILTNSYTEEHRKYHDLDHIKDLLALVDPTFPQLNSVLSAILFHDAVYNSKPVPTGFNEAASAALYVMTVSGSRREVDAEEVFQVVEIINATAHHEKDQILLSEAAQYMLDLDLSSFALPWTLYRLKDLRVEEEMISIYGEELFRKGRVLFLERMLTRDRLFYIHDGWEDLARDNLERRVAMLKETSKPLALAG